MYNNNIAYNFSDDTELTEEASASEHSSVTSAADKSQTQIVGEMALGDLFEKHRSRSRHGNRAATVEQPAPEVKVTVELTNYLSRVDEVPGNSSPLSWWRSCNGSYPILSALAKRYLSICATSVASERVFSVAGNVATKNRNAMKPDNVDRMVFLASNIEL